MRFVFLALMLIAALALSPAPASAGARAVVEVVFDAASGRYRYEPPVVYLQPGDSVLFKSGGTVHASRAIATMQPPGTAPWWGQVGEDVEVTFTVPGVYGHKCGANYRLGLVGLVVVGDPGANLDDARAVPHPPAAAAAFQAMFDMLERRYRAK